MRGEAAFPPLVRFLFPLGSLHARLSFRIGRLRFPLDSEPREAPRCPRGPAAGRSLRAGRPVPEAQSRARGGLRRERCGAREAQAPPGETRGRRYAGVIVAWPPDLPRVRVWSRGYWLTRQRGWSPPGAHGPEPSRGQGAVGHEGKGHLCLRSLDWGPTTERQRAA